MRSSRLRLTDIRDNILLAQSWVADRTLEEFAADLMAFYGVIRCLEIISEASRFVAPDVKSRYPELPWFSIAGAGNVYRHDYERVDANIIWGTVHNALPALLTAVEAELSRAP